MFNKRATITYNNKIPIVSMNNILGWRPEYTFTYSVIYSSIFTANPSWGAFGVDSTARPLLNSTGGLPDAQDLLYFNSSGTYSGSYSLLPQLQGQNALYIDTDDIIYAVGNSASGNYDGKVQKMSSTGSTIWSYTYSDGTYWVPPTIWNGETACIWVDTSKNCYVGGWRVYPGKGAIGTSTYSLIKLSATGSLIWRKDTGSDVFSIESDGTHLYTCGNGNPLKIDFNGVTIATYSQLTSYVLPNNNSYLIQKGIYKVSIANSGSRYYSYKTSTESQVIQKFDANQNSIWRFPVNAGYWWSLDKANEVLYVSEASPNVAIYDKDAFLVSKITTATYSQSGDTKAIHYRSGFLYDVTYRTSPTDDYTLTKIAVTFSLI